MGNSNGVKKENLKQRAYLNSVTSVLDFGTRTIVGFVITPIIVNGLGSVLYGIWQVIGQFTSYTSLADIRATQVLKWAIAKDRDAKQGEELRQYVTATFLLVMILLPIILVVGGIISWFAPSIMKIDPEYVTIVRLTSAILVLGLVTNKVFSIFESILRGMNLGFKRMGLRALIYLLGGGLKVVAIKMGYGIVGLAVVQLLIALFIGITIYVVVKQHVSWFGFGPANIKQSLSFLKLSGWFMGWTGTKLLLISSDKIILGVIAGPILVTQYVITKYLANTLQGLIANVINGVVPGIGKLYGNEEYEKLHKVRNDMMNITWLLCLTIACIIIMFNESFLGLWIGQDKYAGHITNLLIVLMIVQYIFIQNDGAIINTTLEIKEKVYFGLGAAGISIIVSVLLTPYYGIAGLCAGIILGRMVMSIGYPIIIRKKTNIQTGLNVVSWRVLLVTLFFLSVSLFVSDNIELLNWISLILLTGVLFPVIMLLLYRIGLNTAGRNNLKLYFNKISVFSNKA